MAADKKALPYKNHVKLLAGNLESTKVNVDAKEIGMTLLYERSCSFEHVIIALFLVPKKRGQVKRRLS